jgi:hypothetical protein
MFDHNSITALCCDQHFPLVKHCIVHSTSKETGNKSRGQGTWGGSKNIRIEMLYVQSPSI